MSLMNRVRALLISFLGAAVLMAALSYDAVLWAQDFAAGFPGGGGRGIGLLNALYCQLASPCVLTGDNASGTGTLRIRPSDEDTQLVLCEASNNASPEVCSVVQHYNNSATFSSLLFGTNLYLDSGGTPQRYNTGLGAGYIQTVASSTLASNGIYWGAYNTSGAIASYNSTVASGASTATTTFGLAGTMTADFRGPILNGGSATCGGVNAGDVCLNEGTTTNGRATALLLGTVTNCSDGAGAAACSAAPAGSVVIDAAGTTVVVSTTAVTANSQIFVQEDSSLGTKLSVTCNTTTGRDYTVSARTAATSFTITASAAPVTNPACLSYFIVN